MINKFADMIDDYLEEQQAEILDRKEPFEIAGKRQELNVIRLPLRLLTYNIRNGRFAAELLELEASEGRRLDPSKERDAAKIEELLLRDRTKTDWLRRDIERVGQLQPATITHDGFIINGNRRAAILNQLFRETGDQHFAYLEVVRLPTNVSSSDLWRFEAGFQLAVELKADYGPINELLKIKEGREYGLQDQEIAIILGGDNTADSVRKKLKRLDLIEDYLAYFGQDKRYSTVEGRVEHFIDLDSIMQKSDWKKLDTAQQTQVLHAAYLMISVARIPHLDVRKIGKFIQDPRTALEWANKTLKIGGVEEEVQVPLKEKDPSLEPLEEEIQELEAKILEKTSDSAAIASTPADKQQKLPEQRKVIEHDQVATSKPLPKQPKPPEISKAASSNPKDSSKKELLKEVFQETAEKADLDRQKKKPAQILKRVESNLQALDDVSNEHLRPYSNEFNRIEALVRKLATRFG
ncbi:hypothetical protein HL657_11485 [Methanoculleus sp. YWC-01]|uniref:ParB/Sulfiredoxin domain-containing protein n=1 Tax=Methanoculleus nereidis TaxID=2735141 RepID=A0ABU3Z4M8_9EURY|nr:hypothetical protein [Methanoculleus sp. YWC-01]MDV4343778.1 hypothetical protein [Methanoculleus sp. YWC-01]